MKTSIATQPSLLPDKDNVDPTQRKPSKSTETNSQSQAIRQLSQATIEDQIRDRSYQLYVERGSRDDHALQDWLDAEFELFANR